MPYINKRDRGRFKDALKLIDSAIVFDEGELNYLFTEIAILYLYHHDPKYKTINTVVGALECCKQEFYRRLAAPYEDAKITENGDVYVTESEET